MVFVLFASYYLRLVFQINMNIHFLLASTSATPVWIFIFWQLWSSWYAVGAASAVFVSDFLLLLLQELWNCFFFSFLFFFFVFVSVCACWSVYVCARAFWVWLCLLGFLGFFFFFVVSLSPFCYCVCVMCRSDFLDFSLHASFFVDECFKFIFFLFVGLMWGFTFLVVAGMFVLFLCVLCWVDITLHFFLGDICHL